MPFRSRILGEARIPKEMEVRGHRLKGNKKKGGGAAYGAAEGRETRFGDGAGWQSGGNATERSPHQNTRKERRMPEARSSVSNFFIHLSPILICPLSLEVFKEKSRFI